MNALPWKKPPSLRALPMAKTMPLNVGPIHFVGIGGIGMSGIAEILHNLGYTVQGTDLAENYNTQRLKKLGIHVETGHKAEHLGEAAVVVISSAVKDDNPEVLAARDARIPVVRRAEMLAELMRLKMAVAIAGTHGKTTTTALMAAIFEAAELNPTVINGGILNARNTNAYLGSGEWMVVEADESDGTFTRLPATIGIVTNIDPEHLDHYGGFDGVRAAFQTFVTNLPFYGFAVCCIDHPEVQALIARVSDRRIVTYGTSPQADIRAVNIHPEAGGQRYDIEIHTRQGEPRVLKDVFLAMYGLHNVCNSLAAVAVAQELAMPDGVILKAFEKFGGVKRRFTKTGEARGLSIIDDYGHHPVEITATLKAARHAQDATKGRVIAVVQPHRYTRLRDLFAEFSTCFNDADIVVVTEVYSAGEEPIEGISGDTLVDGLKRAGHKNAQKLASEEALAQTLADIGQPGDMVVCLGAGSISKWANALPAALEKVGN
jgi:UDP-N-acetylmuramate--alanine ligase